MLCKTVGQSVEAVAYSEVVVYSPYEVVVVRPSSEAVDPSVEVVDHNCRKMKILARVKVEVELH